jgi:hypothetical protein
MAEEGEEGSYDPSVDGVGKWDEGGANAPEAPANAG